MDHAFTSVPSLPPLFFLYFDPFLVLKTFFISCSSHRNPPRPPRRHVRLAFHASTPLTVPVKLTKNSSPFLPRPHRPASYFENVIYAPFVALIRPLTGFLTPSLSLTICRPLFFLTAHFYPVEPGEDVVKASF